MHQTIHTYLSNTCTAETQHAMALKLNRLLLHRPSIADVTSSPAALRGYCQRQFLHEDYALEKREIAFECVGSAVFFLLSKMNPTLFKLRQKEAVPESGPCPIWNLIKNAAFFDASNTGNARERTSWLFLECVKNGLTQGLTLHTCGTRTKRWFIRIAPTGKPAMILDTVIDPERLIPEKEYKVICPEAWQDQTPFPLSAKASWQAVISMTHQAVEVFKNVLEAQVRMLFNTDRRDNPLQYMSDLIQRVRATTAAIPQHVPFTTRLNATVAAYQLYAQALPISREIKHQMQQLMNRSDAQLTTFGTHLLQYWQSLQRHAKVTRGTVVASSALKAQQEKETHAAPSTANTHS